jgi:nucleoid-associated protein YgaU
MGLLSFIKTAGEKLFGKGQAQAAQAEAASDPSPEKIAAANAAAAASIEQYIDSMSIDRGGVTIEFDGATGTVLASGEAPDQLTKEKILLCCGNVQGVGEVNDMMTVAEPADESQYYTVVSGDSLSKIAKQYYGDANAYNQIFEANRPMLGHPDKIYPGQTLRIPPEA